MRAGLSFSYPPISLLLRQPLSIKKSYAGAIQEGRRLVKAKLLFSKNGFNTQQFAQHLVSPTFLPEATELKYLHTRHNHVLCTHQHFPASIQRWVAYLGVGVAMLGDGYTVLCR
jgi:hypothetical protein